MTSVFLKITIGMAILNYHVHKKEPVQDRVSKKGKINKCNFVP